MNGAFHRFKAGGWARMVAPAAAAVALMGANRALTAAWPAYGQFPVLGALAAVATPLVVVYVMLVRA